MGRAALRVGLDTRAGGFVEHCTGESAIPATDAATHLRVVEARLRVGLSEDSEARRQLSRKVGGFGGGGRLKGVFGGGRLRGVVAQGAAQEGSC